MSETRQNFVRLISDQIKDEAVRRRIMALLDSVVFKDELKVVNDDLANLRATLLTLGVIP
jgi:hypothetical protein